MEPLIIQKPSRELAAFLLEKTKKDAVIPELFDLFGFYHIFRSGIDLIQLDNLIQMFDDTGYCSEELLTQIIELIRHRKGYTETQENHLLFQIDQYLDRHLTQDLQMESMAEALHISYHYLFHFFKQKTGMTLSSYTNRKRLERAVHMLTETNDKVSDIAFRCGFNNSSYFTALFKRMLGNTPTEVRRDHSGTHFLDFYDLEDMLLATKVEFLSILDEPLRVLPPDCSSSVCISASDSRFSYLNCSSIAAFHHSLFASWHSTHTNSQDGNAAIHCKRSDDGGKTWGERETVAVSPSDEISLTSPTFGVCGDGLYLFYDELRVPDTIESLVLCRLNEENGQFERVRTYCIPFRPTSELLTLPNGKLLLAGYSGNLYSYPNIPTLMISDSGEIDGTWRQVPISTDGVLPNGSKLTLPDVSLILCGDILYAFCRNDMRRVPLVYLSYDFGETWSNALAYGLPTTRSGICGGTLSDGRNYLIANADRFTHRFDRSRLCVYFSRPNAMQFDRKLVLFDRDNFPSSNSISCHTACAAECSGKLHITATLTDPATQSRSICLFTVDLDKI